jgi:hypothetical protein
LFATAEESIGIWLLDHMVGWALFVTDGVRTCQWGGARVDRFGVRALERAALK